MAVGVCVCVCTCSEHRQRGQVGDSVVLAGVVVAVLETAVTHSGSEVAAAVGSSTLA